MLVQRILPLPDKGPLFVIGMELTRGERAKMQETVVNNLWMSREYGQLAWGRSSESSSLSKEECPSASDSRRKRRHLEIQRHFNTEGQWDNTSAGSDLLGKESSRKRNKDVTGHCLDSSWWRCHFPFCTAWQTPTNPPASSSLLSAKAELGLCHPHLFIYSSLTSVMPCYNYFYSHHSPLSVWSPRWWRPHYTLYINFSTITLVQNDMQ